MRGTGRFHFMTCGRLSSPRPLKSSIVRCHRWQVWSPGPMFSIGLPGSGNVIRKKRASCGSVRFALANPFNASKSSVVSGGIPTMIGLTSLCDEEMQLLRGKASEEADDRRCEQTRRAQPLACWQCTLCSAVLYKARNKICRRLSNLGLRSNLPRNTAAGGKPCPGLAAPAVTSWGRFPMLRTAAFP
jgi:hypothetical protein